MPARTETFKIIRVVRIGNTVFGNPRYRFYTDQGSKNSESNASFYTEFNLEDLRKLEGTTVTAEMWRTVIHRIL